MTLVLPQNPLNPRFLYKVLQSRPDDSKRGYRQNFLQPTLAPFKNYFERDILMEMAETETNLAGLYAPDGQAVPVGDPSFKSIMLSLQDVKSSRIINPSVVSKIREAGELSVFGAGDTSVSKRTQAKIAQEITRKMGLCDDDVDVTLEYLTVHALLGTIAWPPLDDAGSAISNPPPHFNASYADSWAFPIPSDMNQDIASLVDYEGSAATADQRKYWSDATADILGQFRVLNQIATENYATNLRGGTVYLAQTTFDLMTQNTAIMNWMVGANKEQPGARTYIDDNELKAFIATKTGWKFETYDAFWTYRTQALGSASTKVRVHFLPRNKIIVVPAGGANLSMGTAPIENADESWNPGKMPWSYKDPKPNYSREVGVNTIAWPVFTEEIRHAVLQVLA